MEPQFFIGEWQVLAQDDDEQNLPRLESVRIVEQVDSRFTLELFTDGAQDPVPDLIYNQEDNTLRSEDPGAPLSISFWRHTFFDVIFALRQQTDDGPKEAWVARRKLGPSDAPPPGALGKWKIELSEGKNAADGFVLLQGLDTNADGEAVNKSPFGLFQVTEDSNQRDLYDILVYDGNFKSFNSIFGVRSLNFWQGDSGAREGDRLYATFNNPVSISLPSGNDATVQNAIRGSEPKPGQPMSSPKFGQLMFFERAIVVAARKEEDPDVGATGEEEDTDVGLWVGEPD